MRFLAFIFTLLASLLFSNLWSAPKQLVEIGVLAYRPKAVDIEKWKALEAELNHHLPRYTFNIELFNYADLDSAVATRSLDFILTNPGHYIRLYFDLGLSSPLVTVIKQHDGQPLHAFGGVIFHANNNQPTISISDIRNKTIAAVSKGSLGGYQMQAYELLNKGVMLEQENQILLTGMPHDNVIKAIKEGKADIGFVRTGVLESLEHEGVIDTNDFTIINPQALAGFPFRSSTRLYPEWPLAAMPHVDSDVTRSLTGFLLSLENDSSEIDYMGIYGFSVPANYAAIEKINRALKLPPFVRLDPIGWKDIWNQYSTQLLLSLYFFTFVLFVLTTIVSFNLKINRIRNQLSNIIWGTDVGTWEWDIKKGELIVNERYAATLGYSLKEISPLTVDKLHDLTHPDDLQRSTNALKKIFNHETDFYELEARMRHKRGDWIWVLIRGKIHQWSRHGEALGMSGTQMDISDSKAREYTLENAVNERTAELKMAKEHAEQANAAKSRFLANMSHELRTPMHAIRSLTALTLKRELDDKAKTFLNHIETSAERLTGLLDNLLDLSRLEAGRRIPDLAEHNLRDILGQSLNGLESLLSEKNLVVENRIPVEISASFDRSMLIQVFTNLIANAIQFSPRDSEISIKAELLELGISTYVHCSVQDQGIGIPEADFEAVFDSFIQSERTASTAGGTGLGLAICKELIELHHGKIWAEKPESGAGARVCFAFPRLLGKAKPFTLEIAKQSHREWMEMIESVTRGPEFQSFIPKQLIGDHHACGLGIWLKNATTSSKFTENEIDRITEKHTHFHLLAERILELHADQPERNLNDQVEELKSVSNALIEYLSQAEKADPGEEKAD